MPERGVTLIELIVVLAVLTLLLVLANGPLTWMVANNAAVATTNELVGAVAYSRAQAIHQFDEVVLCGGTAAGCDEFGDWTAGYIAFADLDRDQVFGDEDELLRMWKGAHAKSITILASTDKIVFDTDGAPQRGTEQWRICPGQDKPPAGIMMWASGHTMLLKEATCAIP